MLIIIIKLLVVLRRRVRIYARRWRRKGWKSDAKEGKKLYLPSVYLVK